MSLGTWMKKAAPIILTCLGAIGTVATAVFAVKAAPKAAEMRKEAEEKKRAEKMSEANSETRNSVEGERSQNSLKARNDRKLNTDEVQLTVLEVIQAEAPAFLPAAAIGIGTLLCIFGANALNLRQQATLASAYALAERTYHQYRDKIKTIVGNEADHAAEDAVKQEEQEKEDDRPPWDEIQTFYIESDHNGWSTFFERTREDIARAEYHINRNLNLKGEVTFNELLEFLDLNPIPEGDTIGWNHYDGETFYGHSWIDFEHRYHTTDDGLLVCAIDMPFGPHPMIDPDDLDS